MMSRNAAMKAAVEAANVEYAAKMRRKRAGSWPSTELPPSDFLNGPAFGGGPGADAALKFAEKYGLREPILAERDRIALALRVVQFAVCTACGDSRTAEGGCGGCCGFRKSWDGWRRATEPSDPGYELGLVVIDAIKALQSCKGVGALERLVTELATAVYKDIPQGEGYVEAKVEELNTRPSQELGFEVGGALAGKGNNAVILMAEWTAEMKGEIKAAVAKLKAGEFGDPDEFHANVRGDLFGIKDAIDDKQIVPVDYLIVLAINRAKSFHAKGMQVALAACGGDRRTRLARSRRPTGSTPSASRAAITPRPTPLTAPTASWSWTRSEVRSSARPTQRWSGATWKHERSLGRPQS